MSVEWTDDERGCCFGTCGGDVKQHAPHEDQGCAVFEDMLHHLAPFVAAREAQAAAKAWDEGKAAGFSRAMRYMSDEPGVDTNPPNPYRIEQQP